MATDLAEAPVAREVHPLVRAAAAAVAVEGVGLIGLSIGLAIHGVTGHPSSLALAEASAVFGVLAGLVFLLLARGIYRVRPWARTPVILLQLLALPVTLALLEAGAYAYGVPLGLLSIGTLVLLAQRDARKAFED